MSSEAAIDWLGRGWLLVLAFTAAVLVVALLRRPCRRLFGAERAFQLWLLPPLAMLASQLPHVAEAPVVVLSPVVIAITSAAAALPVHAAASGAIDWRVLAMLAWVAGSVCSLVLAALVQQRYRRCLRGATAMPVSLSRWPVLRAVGTDVGPALVGAWRTRIVLPADFEQRYDASERMLILAHETAHARRHDGWWCLCAQLTVALFWFHPLAWWALAALRHDQELACDAAVLREHGEQRRSYANAMLKTQSAAFALPVGCTWSPRHPLTERIAMLKLQQPDISRQRTGRVFLAIFALGMTAAVYAATPSPQARNGAGTGDRYTLKIDIAMGGHPESMHFTRCVKPGEYTELSGTDTSQLSWQGRFSVSPAVSPAAAGQLEISAEVDTRFDRGGGKVRTQSAKPIVRTMPGQQASIVFGQIIDGKQVENGKLEDNTIKLRVTPSNGCSGSLSSLGNSTKIDQRTKGRSARALGESVAAKAGFVLVNPEALDNRLVASNLEQVPATSALQLIADVDGMRAVFHDNKVNFEPK
ncbi:peptidase M56 [Rhodanobacter sp. Root561]|uniref:M56 family metallopeptidase n=1 Tax=Rhodanobacter sp. Root561 TaxID=1736560 RepID=UPI0006F42A0F|nr:M56 family metallopeptidase [Rhodanobacter sp. Root561]KQZ80020.1 peptidase M56 [Rhodanobacter sp. Root561]